MPWSSAVIVSGAGLTVKVKVCVAYEPTPFMAVKTRL